MTDTDTPDEITRSHQRYRDFAKLLVILSVAFWTFAASDADFAANDAAPSPFVIPFPHSLS